MSAVQTCPHCSAKYDARHGECPACTIVINVRDAHDPRKTWQDKGYLSFVMHGERFAVTYIPCMLNDGPQFRVSHVDTGAGLPSTAGLTKEEARDKAKAVLERVGPQRLMASLAKARALFE